VNGSRGSFSRIVWIGVVLAGIAAGCASGPNWNQRIGHYAYDDAVQEFGPPESKETLTDGTLVADWMLSSGRIVSSPSLGYRHRRHWGSAVDVYETPEAHLVLTFGPDKKLTKMRQVYK